MVYNNVTENRTQSKLHSSRLSNGSIVYVSDKKEIEKYVKNVTKCIKNKLLFYYKTVMQIMVHCQFLYQSFPVDACDSPRTR